MKRLRAGIIGLGVGEKHIEAYQSHPQCDVVAVCDFADEKISMAREKYRNVRITKESEEIVCSPDIDVVSIASFDNYHFDQIVTGIENGKHIFVEKPMCMNVHEAVMIRRLLNEKPDIRLSSNLNLRTCPLFKHLKKEILSGDMGQVFYMEGDYLWGRVDKLMDGWRKDMEFYSIVNGAAVHMIDLLMWITEMRPVQIQGFGNRIATSSSDFRFNDFAVVLMKFNNGLTAKVAANGGCVHPHFHRVTIFGTKKTFIHDMFGSKLVTSRDPRTKVREVAKEYPAVYEKRKVITTFVDSILGLEEEPIVPTEDVFASMSACLAAEEAIQEGGSVTVEYI